MNKGVGWGVIIFIKVSNDLEIIVLVQSERKGHNKSSNDFVDRRMKKGVKVIYFCALLSPFRNC